MLLQSNIFSANELGEIANRLDDEQRALNDYPTDFISENANASGFFSVQVLEKALENIGLSLKRITHPSMSHLMEDPSRGRAYIVNHELHWFTVRKFGNLWFLLNSQENGPRHITPSYLNLFFIHLIENGCSIFHVEGDLPFCVADEAAFNGKLQVTATLSSIDNDEALQRALKTSVEQDELERALKESAEMADFEKATKLSLEEFQKQAGPSSSTIGNEIFKNLMDMKPSEPIKMPIKVEDKIKVEEKQEKPQDIPQEGAEKKETETPTAEQEKQEKPQDIPPEGAEKKETETPTAEQVRAAREAFLSRFK
uniref:Ubiquitinyl hydrolase 1 n=1 Tax=Panagrolaimus sp. JU765 TaxID=591449 RepID=A0AC34QMD6_9BILA